MSACILETNIKKDSSRVKGYDRFGLVGCPTSGEVALMTFPPAALQGSPCPALVPAGAEPLATGRMSRAWVFYDSRFGNSLTEGRTSRSVCGGVGCWWLASGKLKSESSGDGGQKGMGVRVAGTPPSSVTARMCDCEKDPLCRTQLLGAFVLFLPFCLWRAD